MSKDQTLIAFYYLENLLEWRDQERCLRHVSKSNFGIAWPGPWTSRPQKLTVSSSCPWFGDLKSRDLDLGPFDRKSSPFHLLVRDLETWRRVTWTLDLSTPKVDRFIFLPWYGDLTSRDLDLGPLDPKSWPFHLARDLATERRLHCRPLFAFHSYYGSILHHLRDKARYYSKIVIFYTSFAFDAPVMRVAVGILPFRLVWEI